MMSYFFLIFVSVFTILSINTALIFLNSKLFDEKANLVSAFKKSKFEIINSFQKRMKKTKQILRKNFIFYSKTVFDKIDFGI